jgi:hypothetical protein
MKRHILRIALLFTVLFILPGAIIGALGSRKLVSPPRRVLQDYHHEILNHQSDHGLRVLEATAGETPIQIYLPPSNARQIFAAIPHSQKELHLIPEGSHGDVLAQGGNEFYADLSAFFLKHLSSAREAE